MNKEVAFEGMKQNAFDAREKIQKALATLVDNVPDDFWFAPKFQKEMRRVREYTMVLNLLDDVIDALEMKDIKFIEKKHRVIQRMNTFIKFIAEHNIIYEQ